MEPKFTAPVNRLKWRVSDKGVSRSDAVRQAERNLTSIKDEGLAFVDQSLDQLERLFAASKTLSDEVAPALYETSNAIAGIAAVFGLEAMGKAAYSLCELLAGFETSGLFSRQAVKAHLDAMRILRSLSSANGKQAAVLLDNLSRLVSHLEAR
jgi:hypothetical protein